MQVRHVAEQIPAGLRGVTFAVVTAIVVLVASPPSPAAAATPSCSLDSHCWAILDGSGTTFYGLYGNWNRANMTTPSSEGSRQFIDSQMWLGKSQFDWVEMGVAYGYEVRIQTVAYYAFYAWINTSGLWDLAVIASLVPNETFTDEYQVSSPTPTGVWNVWWNGNHYTTPATRMTSFTLPQLGAEIATPNGCANTFNMYSQAYNAAWQRVTGELKPPTSTQPELPARK